jgi:endonuclease/exonuclease/phosphatase family metal-dependent hydrolase
MGTKFRFVSWNLEWAASRERREGQIELIRELAPDLLAVQEVKATTLRPLDELFAWKVFALGPNPDDRYWTTRFGTAVLGGPRATLTGQMLIAPTWFALSDDLRWKANRFARRATWARVRLEGEEQEFLVGSLHASPAAGPIGAHKPWFHGRVARWLEQAEHPWLFGIDANAPAAEGANPARTRWGWPRTEGRPGEDELLGPQAAHRGRDLLRVALEEAPAVLERVTKDRPDGPLAVSYQLRAGPVRYDHCWGSPEFLVHRVEYLQEGFRFSDHAPIVCDLELSAGWSPGPEPAARPPVEVIAAPASPDPRPTPVADEGELVEAIRLVLANVTPGTRDARDQPDPRRRGQFRAGWRSSSVRGRTYTPSALHHLTWNNLGYRIARAVGSAGADRVLEDAYLAVAEQGYRDRSLVLDEPDHAAGNDLA